MNLFLRVLISSVATTAFLQPAFSTQIINQTPQNVADASKASTVERGGTVDSVDGVKKTLTVDGRSFAMAAKHMNIHSATGKDGENLSTLKPGMKIRFNTSKNNYAGRDEVIEIWISSVNNASPKK